jgi:hypothetical protein
MSNYHLKKLFLTTIYEEAERADQHNLPQETYKIITDYLGIRQDGIHSPYAIGNERRYETYINLEYVVIQANNPYRRWVKLYEYCKEISKKTADQYLLPYFDKFHIYGHTTPLDLVNIVLATYDELYEKNVYWIKLTTL